MVEVSAPPRPVILVDMDGVLCDFEAHFLQRWRARYPDAPWLPLEQRKSHYLDLDLSGVYDTARTHEVISEPGFYATMPPIRGALEALREMAEEGLEQRICTAPFGTGAMQLRCEEEKRAWLLQHLGPEWLTEERFVCQKDKSTVAGTLLVDDKPAPEHHWKFGQQAAPSWKHVVFTQPYNIDAPECRGKPRLNGWATWREVLLPLLASGPEVSS